MRNSEDSMAIRTRKEPRRVLAHSVYRKYRPAAAAREPSGALATILGLYIAVVIGRVSDLFHLGSFPIAKLIAGWALVIAWTTRSSLSSIRIRDLPLAKYTLVFMGWSAISIVFSIWRGRTLAVITGSVVATTVATFLIVKAAANWSSIQRMLLGTVGAAAALATSAMITSYAGRAGANGDYDPNDFAYVLVGLLPCVCAFAAASKGWKRITFVGIALWTIVSILLTQSRGGLLGLGTDILLITVLLPISRSGRAPASPSRAELLVRVLVVTLIGLVIWYRIPGDARARLETITSADSGYNVTNRQGRIAIWTRNLPLITKRPWGFGAGTFEAVDGLYGGGSYRAPHNTFLQSLIEVGIPGFCIFVGILLTYFLQARSLAQSLRNRIPEAVVFTKALGISQAGLCVSGFFLSELYANELWLTVALLCAVSGWACLQIPAVIEAKLKR